MLTSRRNIGYKMIRKFDMAKKRALRLALEAMPRKIETDFAAGLIHTEADLQFSIVEHLRTALANPKNGRWFIGSNHTLYGVRPDVACYFIEGDYGSFVLRPEAHLIGAIEIKFAKDPSGDLPKLDIFQQKAGGLAWIVYGDHFSPQIHRANYQTQLRREKAIWEWKGKRADRGCYVLKTANLERAKFLSDHRQTILGFNSCFWKRGN